MKKLFIGNLSWGISSDGLREAFAPFGEIEEAIIIKNERGQSKGFGFVSFTDDAAADAAIAEMNEKELDGRNILVNEARPREERPARY